jgi:CorA-like Mg2+ transporter protein
LLQEEIDSKLSAKNNRQLYVLSIIAALFLPPSPRGRHLGMNVGGLPMLESRFGFVVAMLLIVASPALVYLPCGPAACCAVSCGCDEGCSSRGDLRAMLAGGAYKANSSTLLQLKRRQIVGRRSEVGHGLTARPKADRRSPLSLPRTPEVKLKLAAGAARRSAPCAGPDGINGGGANPRARGAHT